MIGSVLWIDGGEMVDMENEAYSLFWVRMSDDGVDSCSIF